MISRELIEEILKDISTPTGISYSGDKTIANSTVDNILEFIDDLQKKAERQEQIIKSQYGTIKSVNKTSKNRKEAIKSLLVQNEKLKKKAELGEHYKHLYSEVKKQKDDVVEYIKNNAEEYKWEDDDGAINKDYCCEGTVILRMLGEIE